MKTLNEGNLESYSNIAKETKALLNQKETEPSVPDTTRSGLKKPCVFGKHNPNFDKNIN